MLEQGPDFWCWFDTTQFSYIPLCSPNTCKYVFNPNVTTFQSNCAESLHFSAFITCCNYLIHLYNDTLCVRYSQISILICIRNSLSDTVETVFYVQMLGTKPAAGN